MIPPFKGGNLICSPQKSIFELLVKGKTPKGVYSASERQKLLYTLFTRDMGLRSSIASILSSRPLRELERVEQTWHSIIDCFLLYRVDGPDRNRQFFKHLARKVFSVGCFNCNQVITWWKQFTTLYYVFAAQMVVRVPPKVDPENFFVDILDLDEEFLPLFPQTKSEFERVMSFCSARGLPASSDNSPALQKFKDLCRDPFISKHSLLAEFGNEAFELGQRVKQDRSEFSWHFSVNYSGSLESSVRDGGRVSEMMDELLPILSSYPEEKSQYETPFGVIREDPLYQRWVTWFRNPADWDLLAPFEFPGPNRVLMNFGVGTPMGYDDTFAQQVYYVAWKSARDYVNNNLPIPVRISPVPEVGGKTRVVSMGPWWLMVLQSPFGHFLQDCLKSDYDGSPCLYRASPSWDAFLSMKDVYHKDGMAWSFSDMTSCTDAYPKDLALELLVRFLQGMGINYSSDCLSVLVGTLLVDRLAIFEDGTNLLLKRGVLMGEPLTKSMLTLYMSCLRSLSLRRRLGHWSPKELPGWFLFHIGGDDHLVHGPVPYLVSVQDLIVESGFLIDLSRYGYTIFGGLYLQTPFYFRGTDLKRVDAVFTEDYSLSVYCDNIKAKLLSPNTKPHTVQNEWNVAVGKAIALGKALTYNRNPIIKRCIRDRFFWRMGRLLPSRIKENKSYNMILLPTCLGGLGLSLDNNEVMDALSGTHYFIRRHARRLCAGVASFREFAVIRALTTNSKVSIDPELLNLEEKILDLAPEVEADLQPEWHLGIRYTHRLQLLERRGVYTLENVVARISRMWELGQVLQRKRPKGLVSWKEKSKEVRDSLEALNLYDPVLDPTLESIFLGHESLRARRLVDLSVDLEDAILVEEAGFFDGVYMPIRDAIGIVLPSMKATFIVDKL